MSVYKMAGLCHVSHSSFNDSDGSERSPMMTTSPSGHWPSAQPASTSSSANVYAFCRHWVDQVFNTY